MRLANGVLWKGAGDLLSPAHELEVATEAACVLLAERTAFKAELEQLRTACTAIATWSEVGGDHRHTPRRIVGPPSPPPEGVMAERIPGPLPKFVYAMEWALDPQGSAIFSRVMERVAVRTA